MSSIFDHRTPEVTNVLIGLREEIMAACEPYVQEALRVAEEQARRKVAEFAIRISQQAKIDTRGDTITVEVKFTR